MKLNTIHIWFNILYELIFVVNMKRDRGLFCSLNQSRPGVPVGIPAGSIGETLTFQGCENKTLCPSTHTYLPLERNLTLTDFSLTVVLVIHHLMNAFCPKSVLLKVTIMMEELKTLHFIHLSDSCLPGFKLTASPEIQLCHQPIKKK